MNLTPENKAYIDNHSYYGLLERWRNSPAGDPWFQGETGQYWAKVMRERRAQTGGDVIHTEASNIIGWGGPA